MGLRLQWQRGGVAGGAVGVLGSRDRGIVVQPMGER